MILECDIGNTRCKWRLRRGGSILERGVFAHNNGFAELARLQGISRVKVACVAAPDVVTALCEQLSTMGLTAEMAVSTAMVAGVHNSYPEPPRLGVDRWVAMIAAYNRQKNNSTGNTSSAALVLDAGSALTADLVGANGQHLGGYIVPGMRLMKESLLKDTGKVRFHEEAFVRGLALGENTADAVGAGILAAQIGAVQVAIDQSRRRISEDFAILLTGGDASVVFESLPEQLRANVEIVPELVLDGLQWVLP